MPDAIIKVQRLWHVLGKTALGSGEALGAVLDFREEVYPFDRVFDIAPDTLFTSQWINV